MKKPDACTHRTWRTLRGGRAESCTECGMRFPCSNKSCIHVDCWEARGYAICLMCGKQMRKIDFVIIESSRSAFAAHPDCAEGGIHVREVKSA